MIHIHTVYVLQNENDDIYTGQTVDLPARVASHNQNMNIATKNRGPWKLVYSENYPTRSEAMKREKELKTGKRRDFIKSKLQELNK